MRGSFVIIVGDASNVGGRNAVWITRDVDIQAIVTMKVNEISNSLLGELRQIRNVKCFSDVSNY